MSISHPNRRCGAEAAIVALEGMVATAPSLADWQILAGSPMGTPGLFLEGLRAEMMHTPCFARITRALLSSHSKSSIKLLFDYILSIS